MSRDLPAGRAGRNQGHRGPRDGRHRQVRTYRIFLEKFSYGVVTLCTHLLSNGHGYQIKTNLSNIYYFTIHHCTISLRASMLRKTSLYTYKTGTGLLALEHRSSVVDQHSFDADPDPDPNFHGDADPVPDSD